MTTERMLSPKDLSELLTIPVQTIYHCRCRGEGPRAYPIGRHIRYWIGDIESWLDDRAEGTPGGQQ